MRLAGSVATPFGLAGDQTSNRVTLNLSAASPGSGHYFSTLKPPQTERLSSQSHLLESWNTVNILENKVLDQALIGHTKALENKGVGTPEPAKQTSWTGRDPQNNNNNNDDDKRHQQPPERLNGLKRRERLRDIFDEIDPNRSNKKRNL